MARNMRDMEAGPPHFQRSQPLAPYRPSTSHEPRENIAAASGTAEPQNIFEGANQVPQGWNEFETTFGQAKKRVRSFLQERGWENAHSPKNLAMSIAIEAAELMEIFQWIESSQAGEYAHRIPERLEHVRQEVADVVIYCMSMANALEFDLAAAIDKKIDLNAEKYPITAPDDRRGSE